jgi:hypothetical protein
MTLPRSALAACMALATLAFAAAQDAGGSGDLTAASTANPLSGLTLDSLEATRSLPLFTPSRTPPPVPEPEPVAAVVAPPPDPPLPPPSPPPLDLIGIVATGSTQFALLRDQGTGEIHRIDAGDDYDGWSIEFVDSRTVALRNGDQTQTLTMFDEFVAPQPGAFMPGLPPGFMLPVPPPRNPN